MATVVVMFALTLTIVFGFYWLVVGGPELREEREHRSRLEHEAGLTLKPVIVTPGQTLSAIGPMHHLLLRFRGLVHPIEGLVERSGLKITPGAVILAALFAAAVAATAVRYVFPSTPLELLAAAAGLAIPLLYVRYVARKRLARIEEQFPDAIDLISRSLRAGHALLTAIELVGTEMANPIGTEFKLLFEHQNYGMSLDNALHRFVARVPIIDARFFVTAVLTQREVGGKLSELLDRLSAVIRERFTVKRQIRAVSAHGRITGWVLGLLPPVLAVILLIIAPDYMRDLVREPVGLRMVFGAVALQLLGVYLIQRIVNVEY